MIQTSTVRCGNASELMDEISAASVQQAEMISLVERLYCTCIHLLLGDYTKKDRI